MNENGGSEGALPTGHRRCNGTVHRQKSQTNHIYTHVRPLVARICHMVTNTTVAVASAITVSIVPIPTIAVTSSMPSASLRDMKSNITNVEFQIF